MTRQVVHTKRARIAFGFSTNGEKWVERLRWLVRGGENREREKTQHSCLDLPLCRQHLPATCIVQQRIFKKRKEKISGQKAQLLTRTHKRLTFPCIQPPPHAAGAAAAAAAVCHVIFPLYSFYGPICYYIP